MDTNHSIPVTIIGGYLGAGKTTLINHLLRHANGRRLAVMVNEFGELPIDEDLIEAQDDNLISLAGGCVCCSFGNDLMEALLRLSKMRPAPEKILLESSGVALPGPIANTLSLISGCKIEGIVLLADAETVQQRARDPYMGDTINRQLVDADIVLLNKIDTVSMAQKSAVIEFLRKATSDARLVECERSSVPAEIILGFDGWEGRKAIDRQALKHSDYVAKTLVFESPVNVSDFAVSLLQDHPNIVRVKGFVPDQDGQMKTLQIVGKRIEISIAPSNVNAGLVTISSA